MTTDVDGIDVSQPRSEEDQIRRSVFSRCLRLLATGTDKQKVEWSVDVQRIIDAETAKKAKMSAKRSRAEVETQNVLKPPLETLQAPQTHDDVIVFADEVTTIEDFKRLSGSGETAAPATPALPLVSPEDASSLVGSYMRQLLDRVVGLSLNVLSTSALSFLCVMLSITSKPPKGKDALYSLLANYHYQVCEKIGKRQISNRTVLMNALQDAAAMATANKKPTGKKSVPSASVTVSVEAPAKERQARRESNKKTEAVGQSNDDELDLLTVGDATPAFSKVQRPKGKVVFCADDDHPVPVALDDVAFHRKVMTLVQILDPVTTDTLLKKLNDSNNVAADRQRIEHALRTLASQGVLFFENGIAYFAG
jgi:hypothetical protein